MHVNTASYFFIGKRGIKYHQLFMKTHHFMQQIKIQVTVIELTTIITSQNQMNRMMYVYAE